SENRVTFRNPADVQIGSSICNPAACFNGAGNNSYNNLGSPQTYTGVPYGTGYDIFLQDTYGDGWNGTSYVRVYQDGVLIVDSDLTSGSSRTVTFDIIAPVPSISINDVTVAEEAGSAIFTVTLNLSKPGGFNVNYATSDGIAMAGSDYTTTTGTLSFAGTAGETRTITVPIINNSYGENSEDYSVNLSGGTNGIVISKPTGIGTITDTDPAVPNNVPLTLFEEFSGYFDYTTSGGSLRTQPNGTDPCAITALSSNTLQRPIPAGATIRKAYLKWAHSSQNIDDQVTFEGQNVTASVIYGSSISGGRQFYGYMADVTSLVQAIPNPSTNVFDFTGLIIDTSSTYCSSHTVLGGWSLMVFYELATLPAVTINLYDGFSGESNSSSSYTLGGFFAIGASGAKTTVLSWEGDQNLSNNELLSVTSGLGTFTLAGDGDNNGITVNNPFNSTIFNNTVTPTINQTTSYGLDLDTYNISPYITPGETTVTTTVQSGQDFVMVNSVLLKVPSNLITGTVFEDINYGGGAGRNLAASSGVGTAAATVELYNAVNTLVKTATTKPNGSYSLGGMANGNYRVRVVNGTVKSNRTGGAACAACLPVQTYRRNYTTVGGFTNVTNRVGGAFPAGTDPGSGTLTNAQSVSTVTITSEGVIGLDFGFNFNTIVNAKENGQGSLEQFIVNSNNLGETGLNIVSNSIFDPAAGEDTSIFMIPPTGDAQGRTPDTNFASGYFDISISNGAQLSVLTSSNT
ncbi:MAG: Calx-beta domain-containing protein, partial [Flavobacteriaceae bacterium]